MVRPVTGQKRISPKELEALVVTMRRLGVSDMSSGDTRIVLDVRVKPGLPDDGGKNLPIVKIGDEDEDDKLDENGEHPLLRASVT